MKNTMQRYGFFGFLQEVTTFLGKKCPFSWHLSIMESKRRGYFSLIHEYRKRAKKLGILQPERRKNATCWLLQLNTLISQTQHVVIAVATRCLPDLTFCKDWSFLSGAKRKPHSRRNAAFIFRRCDPSFCRKGSHKALPFTSQLPCGHQRCRDP